MITELLRSDGVIIFPTDTVYAIACSINSKKGFDRLCRIKRIQPKKAVFSMIAESVEQGSPYMYQLTTPVFRIINKNLPGPFTFIVKSGRALPSHIRNGRKTLGLRIPDHPVTTALIQSLGCPLITTSLKSDDDLVEYITDPEEIEQQYGHLVDCVVDGGPGDFIPSTVVSLIGEVEILRQGKGELRV